ncbi:type III-A CRISPR-associated protein Csm2 [Pyrococcus kukulkanii]|uniref:CRISPR system Cms protein Csm2 n=1 Tax=Pyrococcus kukulkanii TaxID=1609559 RepID=A0ABV4T3H4_9EURY
MNPYGKWKYSERNDNDVEKNILKEAFDKGNFSKVREYLRDKGRDKRSREALKELYYRVLEDARKRFGQWRSEEIVKNGAIVAAYAVVNDLRTTQIRKIIEMAKGLHIRVRTKQATDEEMKKQIKDEALRMNILMAYYAGKNRSVLPIQEVLEPILNWVSEDNNATPENFEKVYMFFETIVAYHKYFGGKE